MVMMDWIGLDLDWDWDWDWIGLDWIGLDWIDVPIDPAHYLAHSVSQHQASVESPQQMITNPPIQWSRSLMM